MYCEYTFQDGAIQVDRREYFAGPGERKIKSSAIHLVSNLMVDPNSAADDAVMVVQRFIEAARRASWHIGGPDQVVQITASGARWISRQQVAELASSTANFSGDVVFQRAGSSSRVTINSGGVDIEQGKLNLNLNGVTTKIDNLFDVSGYCGLSVVNNSSNDGMLAFPGWWELRYAGNSRVRAAVSSLGHYVEVLDNSGATYAKLGYGALVGDGLNLNNGASVVFGGGSGTVDFNGSTATASAGSAALPTNPAGFITIKVAGVQRKIPFYGV